MTEQQADHAFVMVYFTDHKGNNEQRAERIAAEDVDLYLERMMKRGFIYKGTRDAMLVVPPHHILGCRISYTAHEDE